MKKSIMGLAAIASVIFLSAVLVAAEKMELNEAFKKGVISISITSVARGELVELRIKKQSATPVVIVIKKGRTDLADEVSILLKKEMEIDLSSRDMDTVTVPQTGGSRYTRGAMMLEPPAQAPVQVQGK